MALGWLWWRAWVPVDAVDAAAVCVAAVVLGDMDLHFAWQAWHLVTWIVTLRGRRGTYGTGLALVALGWLWWRAYVPVDAVDAAAFPEAGDTWRHGLALCVAGVALGDVDRHFAWQAWHLWHWAKRLGLSSRHGRGGFWRGRRGTWRHRASILRGRCGTWRHVRAFCVAGVVLGDIERRFCVAGVALMALGWLWWRAWVPVDAVDAAAVCVAGVVLGDMDLHFAWQAWHLVTWIVTLRGRRAWVPVDTVDAAAFGVAGVALGDIERRFCVAGAALGDMYVHSAWQVWHLVTWIVTLRGRRGTYGTGLALVARLDAVDAAAVCVAGVVLGDIERRFCVAGVALGDMYVHSAWQGWTFPSFRGRPYVSLAGTSAVAVALLHTQ